jgi:MSHA pilin protein MshD
MSVRTLQRGMTLIELIVAIVIISISMISVLLLLSSQAMHSGDAMIQTQATHIADAYLSEVIQQQYSPQANPGGRINFNDVDDYNGLNDAVATDRSGTPVPGLNAFSVRVTVVPMALGAVPSTDAKIINVTVLHTSGITVLATGYRTNHP